MIVVKFFVSDFLIEDCYCFFFFQCRRFLVVLRFFFDFFVGVQFQVWWS